MFIDKGVEGAHFKTNNNTNGTALTMYGKTLNKGDWHHIEYTYTFNSVGTKEDGTEIIKYDINVFIDGVSVRSATNKEIKDGVLFHWEPRYGTMKDTDGDGKNDTIVYVSDLHFDLNNIVYTAE